MKIIENDIEVMKSAPTDKTRQVTVGHALDEDGDMSNINIAQFEKKIARFSYCLFCEKKIQRS